MQTPVPVPGHTQDVRKFDDDALIDAGCDSRAHAPSGEQNQQVTEVDD